VSGDACSFSISMADVLVSSNVVSVVTASEGCTPL
jgi:hypothetical protein